MTKTVEFLAGGKKTCSQCREVYGPEGFYAGRSNCKRCHLANTLRRRQHNEAYRAAARRRYRENSRYRAQVAANTARWKARNPEKLRAQNAVAVAIRAGRLVRQPCEECGGRAQAHHTDYDKPLEVRWFCPYHHALQHVAEGRLGGSRGV